MFFAFTSTEEEKRPLEAVKTDLDYRSFFDETKPSILPEQQYGNLYSRSSNDLNEDVLTYESANAVAMFRPLCQIITSDPVSNFKASGNKSTHVDYSSLYGERNECLEWKKTVSQPMSLDFVQSEIAFVPPKIVPRLVSLPLAKQPFQCHQCGKIFKTKYTLAIHLKMPSHTIARPFVCNICGKGFRLSSTLCRHKIIHTSEKPHKCHICQKAFNRSSTLKTHIRTHSVVKEFICDRCGKGFHQKGNLRNHILIHTGEKPYKCTLCRKAFNKLSNLKFHMHVHTDNSPYRCKFCRVSFSRRCDLKAHIGNTHNTDSYKD